jgi:hypothetical protein
VKGVQSVQVCRVAGWQSVQGGRVCRVCRGEVKGEGVKGVGGV